MMFTTEMTQLFAVVLGHDKERVTEALLRQGVMQFITTSELDTQEGSLQSAEKPTGSVTDIAELRKRIEGFLHTVGVIPSAPTEADLSKRALVNVDKENTHLDQIDGERESIRERQRVLQQEVLKLEDIHRQVKLYGVGLSGVSLPATQSLLSMEPGKIPAASVKHLEEGLKGLPALSIALGQEGDMAHYMVISMKRDRDQIDRVLNQARWCKIELADELTSVEKDLAQEVQAKLKKLTDEQKKLQTKVDDLVLKEKTHLTDLWTHLRVNELCHTIQEHFQSSARTVLFAGWLPSSKKSGLEKAITDACEQRCYLKWLEAGNKEALGDDIPIQFNNPPVLAPFQMLVSNFGVPKYGTIDPTPFVMPLYLAMFGVMFADVGQGAVLTILGLLGLRAFKSNVAKQGLCHLFSLVMWCGGASMLFGALFGSYFGYPLIKPLWFDFHNIVAGHAEPGAAISSVYDVLRITIYFGITVISMGLVFNWVNMIRTKQWMELVFDKGGILGGWIYGGGIYTAFYASAREFNEYPAGWVLFLLIGLPALLLFIKEPYHHLKHSHGTGDKKISVIDVLNFLMQWIVELLEIFSGYLSNTLSFMRVAGLGIAHVCLMISFFTLAGMTSNIVFKVLILLLGNVLVIGLEGLSAGIQALRLNYYEFFSKFFHGTGKLHTPISLSSRM